MDQRDEHTEEIKIEGDFHVILRNPPFSASEKVTLKKILSFPLEEDFRSAFERARRARGLSEAECYKRALVDRRLYWSIFHREGYKPKKKTAISLILTLEPDLKMMDDLLNRLGYCLTHCDRFDVVIEACIAKKIFHADTVNNILTHVNLPLLGSRSE